MKKCTFVSVFVIAFILLTQSFVFASESMEDEKELVGVFVKIDGIEYELDPENYMEELHLLLKESELRSSRAEFLENVTKNPENETMGITDNIHSYTEHYTGETVRTDLQKITSNIAYNGSSSTQNYSVTYSSGSSFSIEGNIDYDVNVVRSGASIAYNRYVSYTDTISISIPAKQYGWVETSPIHNYSKGLYQIKNWLGTKVIASETITYYSPKSSSPQCVYKIYTSSRSPI